MSKRIHRMSSEFVISLNFEMNPVSNCWVLFLTHLSRKTTWFGKNICTLNTKNYTKTIHYLLLFRYPIFFLCVCDTFWTKGLEQKRRFRNQVWRYLHFARFAWSSVDLHLLKMLWSAVVFVFSYGSNSRTDLKPCFQQCTHTKKIPKFKISKEILRSNYTISEFYIFSV